MKKNICYCTLEQFLVEIEASHFRSIVTYIDAIENTEKAKITDSLSVRACNGGCRMYLKKNGKLLYICSYVDDDNFHYVKVSRCSKMGIQKMKKIPKWVKQQIENYLN